MAISFGTLMRSHRYFICLLLATSSIHSYSFTNIDCNSALELIPSPQNGDNTCSTNGIVWYFYQLQSDGPIRIVLEGEILPDPLMYSYALQCDELFPLAIPTNDYMSACFNEGDVIIFSVGNDDLQFGTFTIQIEEIDPMVDLISVDDIFVNENGAALNLDDFEICEASEFTFEVSDLENNDWSYTWISPLGNSYFGSTSDPITADNMENGTWILLVEDSFSCSKEITFELVIQITVTPNTEIISSCIDGDLSMAVNNPTTQVNWYAPNTNDIFSTENPLRVENANVQNHDGTWLLEAYDANGCYSSSLIDIMLSPIPSIEIIDPQNPLCEGDQILLVSTGSDGFYNWEGPQGLVNETSSTLTIDAFSLIDIGSYTVSVTNISGCISSSTINLASFDYTPIPVNDLCENRISANGQYSTSCASSDPMLCGGTDHVVYFSHLVNGPGQVQLNITVESNSFIGEAAGELIIDVWEDCNGTPLNSDYTGCLQNEVIIECISEGIELIIPIGSSDGMEGSFDISIDEFIFNNVPNDLCAEAEFIELPDCLPIEITGNTINSCKENFDGCGVSDNPTVWYELDLSQDNAELQFQSITPNTIIGIWDGCNEMNLIACADNMQLFPVTSRSILISVSHSTASNFGFEITARISPENDSCEDAIPPGFGTTCCASQDSEGCDNSNTVWHKYTPDNPRALIEVSLENVVGAGNIFLDVFVGDCNSFTEKATCISGENINVSLNCTNGEDIYMQVSSANDFSCSTYDLVVDEVIPECDEGSICEDAIPLNPITGNAPVCVGACNNNVCAFGNCSENTIWFEVNTDVNASAIIITTASNDLNTKVEILLESCDGDFFLECTILDELILAVDPNTSYFIGIGSTNQETGNFQLCVNTLDLEIGACGRDAVVEITRYDEYADFGPNGPYCPGELVNFKYSIIYEIDNAAEGTDCQWIQGIIPIIGSGWDLVATPIEEQGPDIILENGQPAFNWLEEGQVDYNLDASIYDIGTDCEGNISLNVGGSLSAGDLLPAGWWAVSEGNGIDCIDNTGDPDNMWGLKTDCGVEILITFDFDLQVKDLSDVEDCNDPCIGDLNVNIITFSDGQTGCWNLTSCAGDLPASFDSYIDCTTLVTISGNGTEVICSGEEIDLEVTASILDAIIILNVDGDLLTFGESPNGKFFGGQATINDVLTNISDTIKTVSYEFKASSQDPNSPCFGPPFTLEVEVYPTLKIDNSEPFIVCLGEEEVIEPMVSGGTGAPYEYFWSTGATTSSIQIPEIPNAVPGTYNVNLRVRDRFGCEMDADIIYIVQSELNIIDPQQNNEACLNGMLDSLELCINFVGDYDLSIFQFIWQVPVDIEYIQTEPGCIFINEELSPLGDHSISVDITDDNGCIQGTQVFEIVINEAPIIEVSVPICESMDQIQIDVSTNSGDEVKWELYLVGENDRIDGPYFENQTTFMINSELISDQGINLLVQASFLNGCIVSEALRIDPIITNLLINGGTDMLSFVEGDEISLNIEISSSYLVETINWTVNDSLICSSNNQDCSSITIVASANTDIYCAEVITSEGCDQIECRSIESIRDESLYIPNIFSPNSAIEGNQLFYLQTNELNLMIDDFYIYDRWGSILMHKVGGVSDDPSFSWDGKYQENYVNPGVYVFSMTLRFDDKVEYLKGTITFIR